MGWLIEALQTVREFFEAGGQVLLIIAALTWLMWALIFERLLYFKTQLKHDIEQARLIWVSRSDTHSWHSQQIRQKLISQINIKANTALPIIKSLVTLCPLLGLLGTVSGMIEVFDVLNLGSSQNIRSIAAGFSKCIISTLAGLVSALSGLIVYNYLHKKVIRSNDMLENLLVIH